MIILEPQALFAIAAVISSVSSLIWSIRRSTTAPDHRVQIVPEPVANIAPLDCGHGTSGAGGPNLNG
jgi:hypothetical protein